jgi:hypothetical protein
MAKSRVKKSEAPPPAKKKFTIIVDTREQIKWEFDKCDWVEGVKDKKLEQGDYSIEGFESLVSIERKRSTGEIATNLFEKRFENELERLSDCVKHPFIICEFDFMQLRIFPEMSTIPRFRWKYLRVTPFLLLKGISTFQLKYPKVHWVFAGSVDLGRDHGRSLMKTALQLNGHL